MISLSTGVEQELKWISVARLHFCDRRGSMNIDQGYLPKKRSQDRYQRSRLLVLNTLFVARSYFQEQGILASRSQNMPDDSHDSLY